MRKAVWHHSPLALLLQTVVTNRLRGIQRGLQIARFQHLLFLGVVAPNASKAVGLKLHFHRQAG
ncbi:Uncharacterised protein [Serratia fonticola]|uniref:Uncharacterized protein n=1 Tax=Serratia fonticola TaxID=47917 RepID=A0A4U9UIP2_SERFO|nr:Uncharacterised protein [Serratia fonticola]